MKDKGLKGWRQIPVGGLIAKPGSSVEYETGNWRAFRPIVDEEKCIHCMICVIDCPENCIAVKADKRWKFDMDFCKGCGICANVCPVKCIKMDEERER